MGDTTEFQIIAEWNALADFYEASDDAGLSIPEDSQKARRLLTVDRPNFLKAPKEHWPREELLSILAIAQHHGFPTRLLDWSFNPMKAAYFAASEAYGEDFVPSSDRLGVWVATRHVDLVSGGRVRLVTAPSSSNPNLRAQEGVFTCATVNASGDPTEDRKPMLKFSAMMARDQRKRAPNGGSLR